MGFRDLFADFKTSVSGAARLTAEEKRQIKSLGKKRKKIPSTARRLGQRIDFGPVLGLERRQLPKIQIKKKRKKQKFIIVKIKR